MTQLTWLRQNLFSNWYNSLLTIFCSVFIFRLIQSFLFWVITQAQWRVVQANLPLFLVGRFPQSLYWRIWIVLGIIIILSGITWSVFTKKQNIIKRKFSKFIIPALAPTWLLSFPLILWLIGGGLGLQSVSTNLWNGLLLTLLMAVISIVLSFPLGVLLALGRTSKLFIIRWFSILYIEIVRGLPLIGILFIAQVMLPLFLPTDLRLDRLVRGIAGLVLFSAAYMAENVRGGLQSIPRGQTEAAKALGFNTPLVLILIILPQALRAVIPAIVGQFIGLFKDTSLLSLVGLVELTGIARSILAQPQFLGRYAEVYIFIGLIYWVFCYSMSLASRRLEKQLNNS
ncbi:amino acid ABC transporter permease [Anabaena cylindrica FACHB-243]|uniref:Neutral amino acid ABC transporter membrane protein n=1 Tax=Anabaena cylindrica (strain ATCC 27899 / PCC 7122) TaxID=272123 RepID=K9ZKX1_ANACC|nr:MULTISPECIES: amino acid ABC transporter permease [Anabaena]AFZ59424.1 neutral amino acid ABC transporter membrane protein [Anabaena cylindrica PCC 7122]MBD2417579.1 amino acid ABC transporter permease [Anabaena cylindrica FACHB-243]MBY5283229.1 amino acid ABC transporter permease [Anabaena sp. CCAP 1446/1C]MBY5307694.1 amino acid ABC transporter permease [Anabaena sp. CCAP 1446/1C]MCM2405341.1 amino acid ABC transporter permease [Anabaena sp. CCAP 1446/1C]